MITDFCTFSIIIVPMNAYFAESSALFCRNDFS